MVVILLLDTLVRDVSHLGFISANTILHSFVLVGVQSCQLNASFYSVFSDEQNPLPPRQASSALSHKHPPPSTVSSRRRPSIRSIGMTRLVTICHEENVNSFQFYALNSED